MSTARKPAACKHIERPEAISPDLLEPVDLAEQRTPIEQGRFLQQLRREWVGDDVDKLRWLAALTLREAGWNYDDIATVLKCDRTSAGRMPGRVKHALRQRYQEPCAPGFENPRGNPS